jgi:spermidine synthase
MIGGATPSCWNFKKERSSTYVEDILKILNFVDQDAKHNVLVIGAGSGGLVRKLDKGKFNIDAVEINPKMKEIAVKYFGVDLEEISNLTIDDARHFLTNSKKKYDIIVVDLCEVNDYNAHLFTKEFYEIAKAHLKDEKNGLVITSRNIVVEEEKSILLDQYISNAVLSVFDHYTQTKETTEPGTFETTVFILTDRPDLSTHPELSFIEKSTDENNITANDDITKQMVRLGQSATAALRNQTINNFSEELLLF